MSFSQKHSRNDTLQREKQKVSEKKLSFTITYYPAFQNVRSIIEQLDVLLFPSKNIRRYLLMFILQGFGMARALRITWLDHVGKNCLDCDSISTTTTFATELGQETFTIHKNVILRQCEYCVLKFLMLVSHLWKVGFCFSLFHMVLVLKIFQVILSNCHHGINICLALLHGII